MDAWVHIYTATAQGRGKVANPTRGRLYSRGEARYSFYRRLSGPQKLSGFEVVNKNLHPSNTGFEPRPPVVKRLAARATLPTEFIVLE